MIDWRLRHAGPDAEGYAWSLPVVAETTDDDLNDMNGFHVEAEHAFHALDTAHGGTVEEGSVGSGTGMVGNEFKGRMLPNDAISPIFLAAVQATEKAIVNAMVAARLVPSSTLEKRVYAPGYTLCPDRPRMHG